MVWYFFPSGNVHERLTLSGNVHTVGQKQLATFREELEQASKNPFTVLLKYQKVPWGLLATEEKVKYNAKVIDLKQKKGSKTSSFRS